MLYLLGVALVVFAFLGDEHCVRLLERLRALGIGDLSQSAVLRALPGRLSFAKTPSVGQAVDMSAGHGQRPSVGLPHWIPMISSLQPKIVDYGLEKMYLVTTAPAPITSKRTTSCVVVPFTGTLQQTCFKRERSTDP